MKFQPLIHGLASTQVPWCTKNCIKRASSSLMSSYKSKRSFDKLGVLVFIVVSNYILSVKRCVPSKYMNIFIFFRVIYTRIAQISTSSPSQPLKNSNKYPSAFLFLVRETVKGLLSRFGSSCAFLF